MASEQSDTPTDSFKSADKFSLHVTAGNSYDPSTHDTVIVNGQEPYVIESDLATVYLWVRIKDYQGELRFICSQDKIEEDLYH